MKSEAIGGAHETCSRVIRILRALITYSDFLFPGYGRRKFQVNV